MRHSLNAAGAPPNGGHVNLYHASMIRKKHLCFGNSCQCHNAEVIASYHVAICSRSCHCLKSLEYCILYITNGCISLTSKYIPPAAPYGLPSGIVFRWTTFIFKVAAGTQATKLNNKSNVINLFIRAYRMRVDQSPWRASVPWPSKASSSSMWHGSG